MPAPTQARRSAPLTSRRKRSRSWLHRYTAFVATKRGLATALHSGDPAFDALPGYFWGLLGPVLDELLDAAAAAGEIRADVTAKDLLYAVALLCHPVPGRGPEHARRIVGVLVDGLRCGAGQGRPHYPAAR